jgi:hypothetical protein
MRLFKHPLSQHALWRGREPVHLPIEEAPLGPSEEGPG